ncbi:hypothetical protein BBOMB_1392 [Bifidobacterium bombi DSM 19703]|uniref:Uncharacterized protein n=1 Tax=Bifidobacterium bombi DSM 19703 TaxID=1341695 RepID=A0A086BNM3_9BIFI|nr:hypothetical protein BBOMB_1392 [Bifidobacterium bombi DSM 19703]
MIGHTSVVDGHTMNGYTADIDRACLTKYKVIITIGTTIPVATIITITGTTTQQQIHRLHRKPADQSTRQEIRQPRHITHTTHPTDNSRPLIGTRIGHLTHLTRHHTAIVSMVFLPHNIPSTAYVERR